MMVDGADGLEVEAVAIGGSHDRGIVKGWTCHGNYLYVRGKPRYPLGRPTLYEVCAGADFEQVHTEVYRLETISYARADKKVSEKHFWVHDSLTNDEAFVKIIEGYGK